MTRISAWIIASALVLSGCGTEDQEQGMLTSANGGVMATSLKGEWIPASLASGATNPVGSACTAASPNSAATVLAIADGLLTKTTTHFVGAVNCTGTDTITIIEKTGFSASAIDGGHLLAPVSYSKTAIVSSAAAAAALNGETACGQDDWSATAYSNTEKHLSACSDEGSGNTGAFMTRHLPESAILALTYKITEQGNGLSTSLKPAELPELDFVGTAFYAPKP